MGYRGHGILVPGLRGHHGGRGGAGKQRSSAEADPVGRATSPRARGGKARRVGLGHRHRAKVTWSAMLEQIHGLEVGTFPGTFEAYQQDIHPEDRDARSRNDSAGRGRAKRLPHRLPNQPARWRNALARGPRSDVVRSGGRPAAPGRRLQRHHRAAAVRGAAARDGAHLAGRRSTEGPVPRHARPRASQSPHADGQRDVHAAGGR